MSAGELAAALAQSLEELRQSAGQALTASAAAEDALALLGEAHKNLTETMGLLKAAVAPGPLGVLERQLFAAGGNATDAGRRLAAADGGAGSDIATAAMHAGMAGQHLHKLTSTAVVVHDSAGPLIALQVMIEEVERSIAMARGVVSEIDLLSEGDHLGKAIELTENYQGRI